MLEVNHSTTAVYKHQTLITVYKFYMISKSEKCAKLYTSFKLSRQGALFFFHTHFMKISGHHQRYLISFLLNFSRLRICICSQNNHCTSDILREMLRQKIYRFALSCYHLSHLAFSLTCSITVSKLHLSPFRLPHLTG